MIEIAQKAEEKNAELAAELTKVQNDLAELHRQHASLASSLEAKLEETLTRHHSAIQQHFEALEGALNHRSMTEADQHLLLKAEIREVHEHAQKSVSELRAEVFLVILEHQRSLKSSKSNARDTMELSRTEEPLVSKDT